MKHLILMLAFVLGGCTTTQGPPPDTSGLMADSLFAPPSETITTDDLFTVTPEMKAYLRSGEFRQRALRGNALGLMDALYARNELALDYDTSATRPAGETYRRRSGNCLSLLIMTAAFARELGLEVRFQHVIVPYTWTRNGELNFANEHVNLALDRAFSNPTETDAAPTSLVVDFLPPDKADDLRVRPIDLGTVQAMYLNNRAAEALVENRLDDAYWWARKAVSEHPRYPAAINTLAVVYQRRGQLPLAERTYRFALAQEPDNPATMSNLVPVLAQAGKQGEAQQLAARLAAIQKVQPFYYFNSGMLAMQRQDYKTAREMFRKELARSPNNGEFHFWLGMAHQRLGEHDDARKQMALAVENSSTSATRSAYSDKLRRLKSMRGSDM